MYLWVKEIITTDSVNVANAYLKDGWKLIDFCFNETTIFVLAAAEK